jgi:hypothetical protein
MFLKKLGVKIKAWFKVCWQRRKLHRHTTRLIESIIAEKLEPSFQLMEWRPAGSSFVVVLVRIKSGCWLWCPYRLYVVDLDLERIASFCAVTAAEDWSVEVIGQTAHIRVHHVLRSFEPDASSFWMFDLDSGELTHDLGARQRFLASLNR